MTDSLEDEYKYIRSGYYSRGNHSDVLLQYLVSKVKHDGILPSRWFHTSTQSFLHLYSNLGNVLWAKAASSHMLLLYGNKTFRLWTDSKSACFLDLNDGLASAIHTLLPVETIPVGNIKKCKPFTKRVLVTTTAQIDILLQAIRSIYGLDFT